jgi:S1-C subfamily serine protease
MPSTSYPWRIVVVATISLFGYFYLAYLNLFGLSPDGAELTDVSGHSAVLYVAEGSPAARAGLAVGDNVLRVSGDPIGNVVDWLAHRMNFVADRPISVTVERAGRRLDLTMTVPGKLAIARIAFRRSSSWPASWLPC